MKQSPFQIGQFVALCDDLAKPRTAEELAYFDEQRHLEEKAEMRARFGVPARSKR